MRRTPRFPLPPRFALPPCLAIAALLVACASAPPPAPPAPEPEEEWTIERVVDTERGLVTLFDPRDLAHHAAEPADWYRHGFAFRDDLATGRFVAVLTGRDGAFRVRLTSAPLDAELRAAAGPEAVQRLRVQDRRLLLAGGDAWPSLADPRRPAPDDPRWLSVPNGDYRVTLTAIDATRSPALPDFVFRLEPVESIDTVAYAPGMPQLIVGAGPAVAGGDTSALRYAERCGEVVAEAAWSPLADAALPLPGEARVVRVPEALHERRRRLADAALPADAPLIVAREPSVGRLGMQFVPRRWLPPYREQGLYRELFEVEGRVSCAVRITGVDGLGDELRLSVEPVPMPRDRLTPELGRELLERFETRLSTSSDPAWRYKGGRARHAPDDASRVLSIIEQLALPAAEVEPLLEASNEARALRLLERLRERP